MSDPDAATPTSTGRRRRLGDLSRLLSVASLAIGVLAAAVALPLDAEIRRLQARTAELDAALRKTETDLKVAESQRRLTLELYEAVRKVLERRDKDEREEEAVRVLVDSLAEDPFRWRLLQAIASGASSPEVKRKAEGAADYYRQEAAGRAPAAPGAGTARAGHSDRTRPATAERLESMNVDFFFCEVSADTGRPLAEQAVRLRPAGPGRWRARVLPDEINQRWGYGIDRNTIRFDPGEREAAQALQAALGQQDLKLELEPGASPSPGQLDVFFCGG